MRLSRSKKVVLLGTALVLVGLTGRAAAEESSSGHHPKAAPATVKHSPTPSVTPSVSPSPSVRPPSALSPPALSPSAAKKTTAKHSGGPAGSHMTTGTSAVALTFDDGPDPAQTPKILKLLAQQHVHATFCLVGKNVQAHPELVRRIVAGGNTLCNHTWRHSLTLGKQTTAAIRADLARTSAAIQKAAPGAKVKYFRAPGGNFTPRLVATARQLGMTSIYWKVDPRDWDHPKGESDAAHRSKVIRTVEKRTKKGAIVLSHDYAQPDTIVAYRTLLPWLRKRYKLIALP
jgi:peptidoglycan/xylan/chitin deacetylase (PgdA/CDA1 family)